MGWRSTPLAQRLGIRLPIIQAPMAGVSNPAMVAATCSAGALGMHSIGIPSGRHSDVAPVVEQIKALVAPGQPYGINVFVPPRCEVQPSPAQQGAVQRWAEFYDRAAAAAGLEARAGVAAGPASPTHAWEAFDAAVRALVELHVPVVSFHFGLPGDGLMAELRGAGVFTTACATCVAEARAIHAAGVDLIVVQGLEAGGHRGTFYDDGSAPGRLHEGGEGASGTPAGAHPSEPSPGSGEVQGGAELEQMGTLALLRLARVALGPHALIAAAGGIMDGAGIAGVIAAGADAAWMGTAFVAAREAASSPAQRAVLTRPQQPATVLTKAFTGKAARGLQSTLTTSLAEVQCELPDRFGLADTRSVLMEARSKGVDDLTMTLCGQGHVLCRGAGTADIIRQLEQEADDAVARMC